MTSLAHRTERGAAAVEFALVVPLLLMLLLGVTTAGYSYSNALGVTNAVREGSRFGASADACGGTPPAACTPAGGSAWATSVIQRVRDTQFDDPAKQSKICVQLIQVPATTLVAFQCSASGSPTLTSSDLPAVPLLPAGTCFVRIVAARPYSINVAVQKWDRVLVRTSIARYERHDRFTTCV